MEVPSKFHFCGQIQMKKAWQTSAHQHSVHEIIVVYTGRFIAEIDGSVFEAETGDVLCYRPGCVHAEQVHDGVPTQIAFMAFEGEPNLRRTLYHDADGRIRTFTDWIVSEQRQTHSRRDEVLQQLCDGLVTMLRRLDVQEDRSFADEIRDYLFEHAHEKITVEELAQRVGLSRAHFIREYKRRTGRSPMEDLRHIRIEQAKGILLTTDLPLKAIAEKTGFYDEYHLSKVFKQVTGVPPGRCR